MRLTIGTFDDFVKFFFENGAEPFRRESDEEPELIYRPAQAVRFYEMLFTSARDLPKRYDSRQIDAGFAAMIDCNVPMYVTDLIWNEDLEIEAREAMVSAMAVLFRDLFDRTPLFGTPFMWWDAITYDFECGNRKRTESEEVQRLQDRMFETLVRILDLPSSESQRAALHGLGHLQHPETTAAIEGYLASKPDLASDLRAYARQSAAGLIQ
jgi:hypothetical protein